MKTTETHSRHPVWAMLAGVSAILLMALPPLSLPRSQALAQPAARTSAARTTFTNTAQATGAGALQQAAIQATAVVTFETYLPRIVRPSPPMPVLDDIPTPSLEGSYTVSWSLVAGADRYVLEEATDAGFVHVTRSFTTTTPSQFVQEGGAYGYLLYYRVRADDSWGQGPWSNVKSVSLIYFDNFSDPNSGWPIVATLLIPETQTYYRLLYQKGQYRIALDAGGPVAWFRQPDALSPYRLPTHKYCVEVSVRIEKAQSPYQAWNFYPYWANGGLIFGAGDDDKNLYALCLAVGAEQAPGGPADMGWYIMRNPANQWPYEGCHAAGSLGGEGVGLSTEAWHRFQVGVDRDRDVATVYIDGLSKGTWIMDGLKQSTRVGLVGGDYEVTPVDFRFDDFRVIPNASCTP